jgi:uncharacterized protein
MLEDDQYPTDSPLTQAVTRDGKTVQVDIYEDGEGGWLLEVIDQYNNSTVWNAPFQTDQAALEEALRTIDEDGIDSLIGAPPSTDVQHKMNPMQILVPLSDDELDELDSFLMSDATSDETMMLDCLDGYLTAIVSGPVAIKPSEWLPRVWGPSVRDEPSFETLEHAERITGLIFRHMNSIIWSLQDDPDAFEPVFDIGVYPDIEKEFTDGEMWAYGYMNGINLQRQNWKAFFDDPNSAEVLRPIYLLGADDVTPEDEELTKTPVQREKLSEQIPASVAWIYRFWQPYRQAVAERTVATSYQRDQPKVGRNEECPCGSGKKFKKCCGVPTVLH